MRKIILQIVFAFLFINNISSQPEVWFYNWSSNPNKDIKVKIYPVSMVFNGEYEYNLKALNEIDYGSSQFHYIAGVNTYFPPPFPPPPNPSVKFTEFIINRQNDPLRINHDNNHINAGCQIAFGFGKYIIEVWWDNFNGPPSDYVTLEYDAGYRQPPIINADLSLSYVDNGNDPRIQFAWIGDPMTRNTRDEGKKLECWRQYGLGNRPKNFGNFRYGYGSSNCPNTYTTIPQDSRVECVWNPYLEENQDFEIEQFGNLSLKLTIDKNIFTTLHPWSEEFPTSKNIIINNEATLIVGSLITLTMRKYLNHPYGTDMIVESGGTFELEDAPPNQHTFLKVQENCNFKVLENGKIKFGEYAEIFLERAGSNGAGGIMYLYPNSRIEHENMAEIQIKDYAILNDCGPIITGSGVFCILKHPNGTWNIGTQYCNPSMVRTFTNGEFAVIAGGPGAVNVASGCKIVFDGPGSFLKCEPGSVINFGQNAFLEFRNGAYIEANGCTFTNLNTGEGWNGIVLDGAGSQSVIQNCTFNNATKSIYISNSMCNISGNTFNAYNTTYGYGIEAINVNNITIQNNIFNSNQNTNFEGIRFFNYEADGLPGGGGVPVYSLNVVGNFFNGGTHPIEFLCVTAAQLPFYVANNTFNPIPGGIYENYGVFAYNITGDFKNNTFNLYNSTYLHHKTLTLQNCNLNIYNNNLKSGYQTIWTNNGTIMQMSPIQNSNGQWVWVGGYNQLKSDVSHNIEFQGNSNPIISPNGRNCFTVNTQPNYNFYGNLCLGSKPYRAFDNYWSPTPSVNTFDISCNGNPVNVTYSPILTTCSIIDPDGYVDSYIYDLGNGIYDTVNITSGGEGGSYPGNLKKTSSNADVLYFEAIQKRKQRDYTGAINKCKELINEHDTSSYFNSALSELYLNYLESDTSGNQTITNGLFNNLKTYIEQKMQQYPNNAQFVERAYKYHLMCLVKAKNYTEAIAGYENIMNNHPDPIVRLNASWDRSAVVFMMGQGGAENDNSIKSSKSRNTKLLDKNPAHRIAKDIYREQKLQSEQIEKNITDEQLNNEDISTVVYNKEEKQMLERRIENYNPTDKKDFMEKLSKDIKLIEQINTVKNMKRINTSVPRSFKLHQNYPNPFNPVTTIKYEIPKDAEITIKVYDLLGREVFSFNEYKKAGSYEVKFDGANLASGMYLYSFETNGYKDTKKMVLLK